MRPVVFTRPRHGDEPGDFAGYWNVKRGEDGIVDYLEALGIAGGMMAALRTSVDVLVLSQAVMGPAARFGPPQTLAALFRGRPAALWALPDRSNHALDLLGQPPRLRPKE